MKEGDIGHEVREWNGKEKGNEREWRRREWHQDFPHDIFFIKFTIFILFFIIHFFPYLFTTSS